MGRFLEAGSCTTLRRIESIILWIFLGLGGVILLVLAGVLPPPLAFLLTGASA